MEQRIQLSGPRNKTLKLLSATRVSGSARTKQRPNEGQKNRCTFGTRPTMPRYIRRVAWLVIAPTPRGSRILTVGCNVNPATTEAQKRRGITYSRCKLTVGRVGVGGGLPPVVQHQPLGPDARLPQGLQPLEHLLVVDAATARSIGERGGEHVQARGEHATST